MRSALALYFPATAELPDKMSGFGNNNGVEAADPGNWATRRRSIKAAAENEAQGGLGEGISFSTQEVSG